MATERAPQPCGGKTGYGCGKDVNPGPGRADGENWWHGNEDCQRARNAYLKQAARERAGGDRVRLVAGGEEIYRIRVGGVQVGWVLSDSSGWTARLQADPRWAWAAPLRGQAVDGLVRHLEETRG